MASKVFIDVFDQLSYTPHLFINKADRNKSLISACIGLLAALSVVGLTIYFLHETVSRKTPVVFFNEREDYYPNFNLSSWPIYVGLSNGNARIYDPQIFHIKIFFMKYGNILTEENKIVDDNKFIELPLEDCDTNEFKKLNATVLDNIQCLNPNKHNLTISGIYGDQTKGYTYLNIFLNRCVNTTDIVCKQPQEIENYLKNVFFIFGTPMNYIDNNNVTDPFILKMKGFNLPMSSTMFKRYYIRLRNIIYDTDIGFVFEERDIKKNFVFSDQELSIDLKVGAFLNPSALGQITFQSAPVSLYYNRSYSKLQSVIANSGGALNAIYTAGLILMYFLTKKDYFLLLSNNFFSFKNPEEIKIRENKLEVNPHNNIKRLEVSKEKNQNLELKFCEKLFPNEMCLCSDNLKKYSLVEDLIAEKLSYEEILNNMIRFENLLEIIFNEEQLTSFKSIQKRNVEINNDKKAHLTQSEVLKNFKNNSSKNFNREICMIPFRNLESNVNDNNYFNSNIVLSHPNEESNLSLNNKKNSLIK